MKKPNVERLQLNADDARTFDFIRQGPVVVFQLVVEQYPPHKQGLIPFKVFVFQYLPLVGFVQLFEKRFRFRCDQQSISFRVKGQAYMHFIVQGILYKRCG